LKQLLNVFRSRFLKNADVDNYALHNGFPTG